MRAWRLDLEARLGTVEGGEDCRDPLVDRLMLGVPHSWSEGIAP